MPTQLLFREDPYLRTCTARVVAAGPDSIVLDRTVFYAQGGGQPGDAGVLRAGEREIRLVDTRWGPGGQIVHVPEQPCTIEPDTDVEVELDWARRHAHMRVHTSLHLLGAVLRYGVTGGAIHATRGRLDFDLQDTVDKDEVTERMNALIRADHALVTRWITDEELAAQPELVRTMSVKPPTGQGRVRLVEIPGVDLQPCGGTHVARTSEIGPVCVSKVEKKGRHNRRVHVVLES